MIHIEEAKIGKNGYWELRNELDRFVKDHFKILYEGAVRTGRAITEDYYAPRRVQIGETRLHAWQGLKYANGHKYNEDHPPTEKDLRQTVDDLNILLKAAAEDIAKPFEIVIPKM